MNKNRGIGDEHISRQNISYYDKIAPDYDAILDKDADNNIIRQIVAARFINLVKGNQILDFGGGTGLDLAWMIQQKYQIIFCELSKIMRQRAKERISDQFAEADVVFLENDKADFRNWTHEQPFNLQMDAVLANFAVLNCIPDINCLFQKLALPLKPGGVLLVLILDNSLLNRFRLNRKGALKSLVTGSPTKFHVEFKGDRQLVFVHSMKSIRKASEAYFQCFEVERFRNYGYRLIHLIRT
jgi:SAM-dependent methyltransferase